LYQNFVGLFTVCVYWYYMYCVIGDIGKEDTKNETFSLKKILISAVTANIISIILLILGLCEPYMFASESNMFFPAFRYFNHAYYRLFAVFGLKTWMVVLVLCIQLLGALGCYFIGKLRVRQEEDSTQELINEMNAATTEKSYNGLIYFDEEKGVYVDAGSGREAQTEAELREAECNDNVEIEAEPIDQQQEDINGEE